MDMLPVWLSVYSPVHPIGVNVGWEEVYVHVTCMTICVLTNRSRWSRQGMRWGGRAGCGCSTLWGRDHTCKGHHVTPGSTSLSGWGLNREEINILSLWWTIALSIKHIPEKCGIKPILKQLAAQIQSTCTKNGIYGTLLSGGGWAWSYCHIY